jgi:hypothetical protein
MNADFIREWVDRANTGEEGSVFQFVCYYIAFNSLYDEEQGYREFDRITKCVKNMLEQYNFNPYNYIDSDSELLKGVMSERSHNRTDAGKLARHNIVELYKSLYYVRCNLFHGAKSMEYARSIGLVRDCCAILRSLFNTIGIQ